MRGLRSAARLEERALVFVRRCTARFRALSLRLEGGEGTRGALFFLLLALIGACMFLLNVHTPLQMDDYDYSISWSTGEPLCGFRDVIASQAAHYMLWGGRSVVHALAQGFLYLGKHVFNVANTAAYLLLLLEVYALARPRGRRFCWALLLGEHVFLFTCVPFFGTVFLWLDGACNYLWGPLIALWPLLILRSAREGGFFSRGRARGLLAVPLCFLAGWTNENTACGVLALTAAVLGWDALSGRRVRAWQGAALLFQAAGAAVMILAPGNFARASGYVYDSMALELLRRLGVTAAYTGVYAGGLLVLLVFARSLTCALKIPCRAGWAAALAGGGLLAALAMAASPELSDRSFTGVMLLLLSAVMTLVGDLGAGTRVFDTAKWASLPLMMLLAVYGGYQALGDVTAHEAAWAAQIEKAQEAAARGETCITLQSVKSTSRFTMDILLAPEPQQWPNSTLGRVLGIEIYGE